MMQLVCLSEYTCPCSTFSTSLYSFLSTGYHIHFTSFASPSLNRPSFHIVLSTSFHVSFPFLHQWRPQNGISCIASRDASAGLMMLSGTQFPLLLCLSPRFIWVHPARHCLESDNEKYGKYLVNLPACGRGTLNAFQ